MFIGFIYTPAEMESDQKGGAKAVVVNPGQESKGDSKKKFLVSGALVLVIAAIAGGVWYVLQEPTFDDLGNGELTAPQQDLTAQDADSVTPTEMPIDKSEVRIGVFNGTGVAGEAAYLRGILEELDYEDIETDNADESNYQETHVFFSDFITQSLRDELVRELEDIYTVVRVTSGDAGSVDIRIITGPRRNITPSPTIAPSPTVQEATESATTN